MQKSILITGASSGIGLQTALTLQQQGYRVFASARKSKDVLHLRELKLESVQLDVTDPVSIRQALAEVVAATGGTLDALFNNAGFIQPGAIEDLTWELNRAQFDTNVFGAMEVIRQVLPIMRRQGHGYIIQNSSILGIVTLPYYGAYNASKFALEGFTSTLRQELRGTKIHVSAINPGPIRSELRRHALTLYQHSLANPKTSPHAAAYQKLEQLYTQPGHDPFMLGPEAVAQTVLRILRSRRPKAHYFVTLPAKGISFLKRLLPESVLEWLLTRGR